MVYRFDTRDFAAPRLVEAVQLVPSGATLTTFAFLNGEQSLVVGSSAGTVDVYFRLPRADARTQDGFALVRAHAMAPHAGPVTLMSMSQRSKMLATADAGGHVWIRHSTSNQTLLKLPPAAGEGSAYTALMLAPRDDGVLAAAGGRYHAWAVDIPHPETTLRTIFGKVWYEGYGEPVYTWQSSAGTDSFEPKFSLVPLIFGTFKATLYSLLFAVPIALGAAIYTSEFTHHRVRATVKPAMEMMASLPSVVLGFIAALILAPFVETWLAAVVAAAIAIPFGLLAAAYLWQLLPAEWALRHGGALKFLLMFATIGAAVGLAILCGPLVEYLLFAGDVMAWANGDIGGEGPFMLVLLAVPSFFMVEAAFTRSLGDRFHARQRGLPRHQAGLLDIGRWLAVALASLLLAYVLGLGLAAIGLGARGGIVDTYTQRNTLVVGFAMGFAVIPIVYTIAEDALSAVPEHLRAASLACGASAWQTAVSVILPTALSGVFAAVMVGMGRAVGETMIVVMAAGNTPLIEMNVFNGLRALSANIAVELPEAVRDGTLYRLLFLAALVLFAVTFAVNTVAEVIRLRFRRRAAQL
ncbi:MAG: ABC transporter permease subunit [Alphaproteobacteria bacterium]|nr:ABC transporter permease subunit [Alphaproteobacteria bacterium]